MRYGCGQYILKIVTRLAYTLFVIACRVIPMIAFPQVRCMLIYIYTCLSLMRVFVVYIVKLRHSEGLGQLKGDDPHTSRKKATCSFT